MIKAIVLGFIILAIVVPFLYIFLSVIGDVAKRVIRVFSLKVKPAFVLITKSILD